MDGMLKTRDKRILRAIVLFAAVWIFAMLLPATAHAENVDGPLKLEVKQTFVTTATDVDDTFTYKLQPLAPSNPMPAEGRAGDGSDAYTFTIKGDATTEIPPISFDQGGEYWYEISQVVEVQNHGYTYDTRVYTVYVYVEYTLDVQIAVYGPDDKKVELVEFENGFGYVPLDIMVDPPVIKTVSGNPSSAGVFAFSLAAENPSQPMPAGSINGVKTIQIFGSGQGEFGTWSYDNPGVYRYTVREENTGLEGYTYDTTVYTLTDTITVDNGQLVLNRVITNDQNRQVTNYPFINTYYVKPVEGPKTGDGTNTPLLLGLLGSGAALAAGATLYLFMKRKRQTDSVL